MDRARSFPCTTLAILSLLPIALGCDPETGPGQLVELGGRVDMSDDLAEPPDAAVAQPSADSLLLDEVEEASFRYFWDFAHPVSRMARERTTSGDVVTSGGTGFGVAATVAAVHRGYVTRAEAVARLIELCAFLSSADRFHGAYSHWLNGSTGKVVPFSMKDDGGDLVETSFLMAGLLSARAYFDGADAQESALRATITQLWQGVEWSWYASRGDGKLYWHWSPTYAWQMNLPIVGWNEALITYVLALASPTFPISPSVYQGTWPTGFAATTTYEGYALPLGPAQGGPLFLSHYSFLELDPRAMQDTYTSYWSRNVKHTLINRAWCLDRADPSYGYGEDLWGLTASDDPDGYAAHRPGADNGTISPTAAVSSLPYTPHYALSVMRRLSGALRSEVWGDYGYVDAFNLSRGWYDTQYLAIDQGPIVVMIENYRSGLLWNRFMGIAEIQAGLGKAGISRPSYPTGFHLAVPEVGSGAVDLVMHPDSGAFELDVAIAQDAGYTLSIERSDGTLVETIWGALPRTPGTYVARFGTALPLGAYVARLAGGGSLVVLPIVLH